MSNRHTLAQIKESVDAAQSGLAMDPTKSRNIVNSHHAEHY